jgi:hypothetical protein
MPSNNFDLSQELIKAGLTLTVSTLTLALGWQFWPASHLSLEYQAKTA